MTENNSICTGIPVEQLDKMREEFLAHDQHKLAQDMCHYHSIRDLTLSPRSLISINHVFNTKIEEGKPITNQKSSGRCWIFAYLNQTRIPFMEKYELAEFEFSQAYLFFWDKLERSNYLLDAFVDCARKGQMAGSRVVDYLLTQAIDDGGQWDMLVNLIVKHGIIPKTLYPETISCEMSKHLGAVITSKMKEYCKTLQEAVVKGVTDLDLKVLKKDMLKELYTILAITLGTPPATITWEYYNKNKVYHKVDKITPLEFYKQYVHPCWDVTEMVCLVNDPRANNAYNKLYTVEYLGNVTNGKHVLYINQPAEQLKKFALAQLQDKKSVWFGCDVGKQFQGKQHGVLDLKAHDYKKVFGCEVQTLNKAERLIYRESLMTHAMLFTGVNVDGEKTDKWRVENSWGDEDGDKGYLVMTDDWFSEYVYEVVIHKKYLPAEILAILDQNPIVLPAWDPMGSLA